jgi:hypothetical protein
MLRLFEDVREIVRLLTDPDLSCSHFPDEPRKSQPRILAEHLYWRLRHGEVCKYYFCWGMDRRGAPPLSEFLSYKRFRSLRDRRNQNPREYPGCNYTVFLRDKQLFEERLRTRGFPTPRVLAVVDRHSLEWLEPRRKVAIEEIVGVADGCEVFCKPLSGEQGRGIFPLRVTDGRLYAYGAPVSVSELAGLIAGPSILQERVTQHPALTAVHPASLNTVRIVTVRENGAARLFSYPCFRVGSGGSAVDNFKAGGIQVFVDPESGRLRGPGRRLKGGTLDRHPDTGVVFDGFEFPFFAEAADLVCRLHDDIPGLHSVGWDVGITPNGPTIIEGNDNWNGSIRMGLDPNFKRDFLRLCVRR